ncbi:LysR family transcriptional regulator [Enterocloster lavalensis]|uniref:LysR family transcriptional regulator n=1 Tax=Enterocloster lavalensis TaxID=460384 RepID=UPI002A81E455|nr:LysR family transcriptional regulator [Enterocloster lavalensis]
MALREYEYFLAIAEENNITKAAQKLHVSQPSLTQQLKRTEHELDCKLLIRTNNGVQLTEAGETYLQLSRQILQLYENFQYEIGQLKKLACGKLRIGASWYLSTTFVSPLVSEYTRLYPGIQIDCIENRTSLLLEQLHSGQIDIAFVSRFPHENAQNQKRLTYVPLYRDKMCVVAHTGYQMNKTKDCPWIDLTALDEQPFIMFRPNKRIRQITDRIFAQAGIRPQIRLTTYGFPTAIAQAAAGIGITILPEGYVETVREQYDIQVYSLAPEYCAYWDIGAYYPYYDIMPFALKAFVDKIQGHFEQ